MSQGLQSSVNATASSMPPLDKGAMFKEAGLTALLIFMLSVALVGIKIEDVSGGLALVSRFQMVFVATGMGFAGRIALILMRQGRHRLVLTWGGPVVAAYWIVLLADIESVMPFSDVVVNWLVGIVALILLLRAGTAIWQGRTRAPGAEAEAADSAATFAQKFHRFAVFVAPVLLLLALAFPFMPFVDRHLLDIAVLVITYVMLGWGLNIVVGLAGLLDLGYVAFYAVGAYSYALLAANFDLGFWICLPLAGIMAAFAGMILGFPVLRLRGDYLAIVTLGFGEMIRVILLNWYTFTGGPDGLSGIPRPTFFGLPFARSAPEGVETFHSFFNLDFSSTDRVIFLFYLIMALALLTNLFTLRIRKLPIGRAWEALREDEIACKSLGINPTNTKLTAFSIGAMFAGFAGSFFATRQGFISPESFTFIESAVILAVVVLGGMGSQVGVVLAAVILIGLPEFFRELQEYRMLAFGGAMVLIMLWRPAGLLAFREPTLRLHPKPKGGKA